jgi:hypothetical protein
VVTRTGLVARTLHLRMGIMDLKVPRQGEVVWLELNSQGQFLWVEALACLPLTRVCARFLHEESERGRP